MRMYLNEILLYFKEALEILRWRCIFFICIALVDAILFELIFRLKMSTFFTIFAFFFMIIIWSAVISLTIAAVQDKRMSVWEILKKTMVYIPTMVLLSIIKSAILLLGHLLFLLPGLFLLVVLIFSEQEVIISKELSINAMKKSYHLVQGQWIKVALYNLAFFLVPWFIGTFCVAICSFLFNIDASYFYFAIFSFSTIIALLPRTLFYLSLKKGKDQF